MQVKTIKQILRRTIMLQDESYIKFAVEQEAELEDGEDPRVKQQELFNICKEQMNIQTKVLLKK